jgi:hypothetical protein
MQGRQPVLPLEVLIAIMGKSINPETILSFSHLNWSYYSEVLFFPSALQLRQIMHEQIQLFGEPISFHSLGYMGSRIPFKALISRRALDVLDSELPTLVRRVECGDRQVSHLKLLRFFQTVKDISAQVSTFEHEKQTDFSPAVFKRKSDFEVKEFFILMFDAFSFTALIFILANQSAWGLLALAMVWGGVTKYYKAPNVELAKQITGAVSEEKQLQQYVKSVFLAFSETNKDHGPIAKARLAENELNNHNDLRV